MRSTKSSSAGAMTNQCPSIWYLAPAERGLRPWSGFGIVVNESAMTRCGDEAMSRTIGVVGSRAEVSNDQRAFEVELTLVLELAEPVHVVHRKDVKRGRAEPQPVLFRRDRPHDVQLERQRSGSGGGPGPD